MTELSPVPFWPIVIVVGALIVTTGAATTAPTYPPTSTDTADNETDPLARFDTLSNWTSRSGYRESLVAAVRHDGGYLAAGSTFEHGNEDAVLAQIHPNGSVDVVGLYGGAGTDWVNDIVRLHNGTLLGGSFDGQPWMLRVDDAGDVVSNRTVDAASGSAIRSIGVTHGGAVILGGVMVDSTGDEDGWIARVAGNGSLDWSVTLGGPGRDWIADLTVTEAEIAFTGSTNTSKWVENDVWIGALSHDGRDRWSTTLDSVRAAEGKSILKLSNGGYLVTGITNATRTREDALLVRVNRTGGVSWRHHYGGIGPESAEAAVELPDGFLFVGVAWVREGDTDAWLVAVNETGGVQTVERFGGRFVDWGSDVLESDEGYVFVGGYDFSFGQGQSWVMHVEPIRFVPYDTPSLGGVSTVPAVETTPPPSDGAASRVWMWPLGAVLVVVAILGWLWARQ